MPFSLMYFNTLCAANQGYFFTIITERYPLLLPFSGCSLKPGISISSMACAVASAASCSLSRLTWPV